MSSLVQPKSAIPPVTNVILKSHTANLAYQLASKVIVNPHVARWQEHQTMLDISLMQPHLCNISNGCIKMLSAAFNTFCWFTSGWPVKVLLSTFSCDTMRACDHDWTMWIQTESCSPLPSGQLLGFVVRLPGQQSMSMQVQACAARWKLSFGLL